MIDPLTDKNVVILGLARQGMSLARWLCEIGAKVTVSDSRSPESLSKSIQELEGLPITYVLGEHPEYLLNGTDLICVSGGVPLDIPLLEKAREEDVPLTNDAQIFMDRCPCHVVGITGSAGKTTTTALVGKMFEAAGRVTWVGGNIGNPLLDDVGYMRPDDVAVMELSSFQLELMITSPHIAAILNITPNHLDRHKTMKNYVAAKARILENQIVGDWAILGYDDDHTRDLIEKVQSEKAFFSGWVPVDVGAWLVGEKLVCRPRFDRPMEPICMISELKLRGKHNVNNVLAACAIAGAADLPIEAMQQAVREFEPVEHRLEVVREHEGVTYINDSIATAPERVIAALKAYPDERIVLLLGGRDKDLPWANLIEIALQRCRGLICFGEAGLMISSLASNRRGELGLSVPVEQVSGLEDAVQMAYTHALPGDVVMLSPGGTSYDAYVDFAERGAHFRKLVSNL